MFPSQRVFARIAIGAVVFFLIKWVFWDSKVSSIKEVDQLIPRVIADDRSSSLLPHPVK